MNVTLTGSTAFIGSHVLTELQMHAKFGSPECLDQRCPAWVCEFASVRVRSAESSRSAAGIGWCRCGR
jgi:hypothetical protein